MTINISLAINDGIVLATDSATTITQANVRTRVYNNANKLFHLVKGLPIGATTAGSGNIGQKTIATLSKDLRARLTKQSDPLYIHPGAYTIEDVANKAADFFYQELQRINGGAAPGFELIYRVFGYSSGNDSAEGWGIVVTDQCAPTPFPIHQANLQGLAWCGMTEAVDRLVVGLSPCFRNAFAADLDTSPLYTAITTHTQAPIWNPIMPLQDGIELVRFLAESAATYAKMTDLAAGVGGPIEVATITRHEGFKWIARKHYFVPALNQ